MSGLSTHMSCLGREKSILARDSLIGEAVKITRSVLKYIVVSSWSWFPSNAGHRQGTVFADSAGRHGLWTVTYYFKTHTTLLCCPLNHLPPL